MSAFNNPFNPNVRLGAACPCGKHRSQAEHDAVLDVPEEGSPDALSGRVIQSAVMRALFPRDATRRRFLSAIGSSTALAAISGLVPLGALEAMAQDKGALEKKDLKIGFIPITCATPLIMADPLGFYRKQGLNVTLNKTAGWALIRDKMLNKEHDASHFLSPMPLAISLGLGSAAQPMNVATIQNINGQA
ncbi:MAG TPA: ABC transporter substrate-binding protein, partial [Burkholderiales bacterium]|nr:ABC transporter substrate-binding protein [Burkholderiales bacterium]